ncbi:hypothetical protein WH95_08480 [Kiloniella litopenaei]|uniref:DUF3576 domain-containing protein n=1 Tax=Kiloniella litopenaei TaxID=1549748 RepID=A0A0M2R9H5_9PROT|nr:DUF3576 domain-containing protein [Kiloniella litopenaei]KKJ77104.1 hypothetical protein WH95_08480 [Kiloniella litopenaei]
MTNLTSFVRLAFIALLSIFLLACEGGKESDLIYDNPSDERYAKYGGSILGGDGGVNLLDLGNNKPQDGGAGVGVNSFLWRASLDTIAFMPLTSADPFGGVIITDWYSPDETKPERFKVNVFILGRDLRADGVRASVFKQQRDVTGSWIDAKVDPKTGTELEDAILTRARQLRIASSE